MDLRRWHYFAVLAEEMHFTRAAARLFVSQPSLSQQIRAFEAELGVALLDRTGPRFALTEAGRVAAAEARDLLDRLDHARGVITATGRGDTGRLRIAYTRSAPGPLAGDLVAAYRARYPEVSLALETGWTSFNLARLLAGEIDLGFVRPPVDAPGLEVAVVGSEEVLIALPSGHALARRRSRLRRAWIAAEPVVFWPRENGPGQYDAISAQVWPGGVPRIVREEPEDEQLMRAVAEGAGIAAVPEHRARGLRRRGVVLRRLEDPVPRIDLGLAWRAGAVSPVVRGFVALARGAAEQS
ncbi:DNA-binding transcriptional LysR family regulator [Amycolatopsis lexingtonensis]|uniref:DNA-binding transcriptional LysR family regulator n=1 Tax=Amycolatopsis lexingtonensis TaxID=218822 RepID=A0ABR9HWF3_9PSEU|nr:LysR family transcriptional regulator [Amycolatopsis lexingtonensis]MBE1495264.1 DNA-binding transcriptional LysR family regulator [Amycolatopsis lexingtonensis]